MSVEIVYGKFAVGTPPIVADHLEMRLITRDNIVRAFRSAFQMGATTDVMHDYHCGIGGSDRKFGSLNEAKKAIDEFMAGKPGSVK